MFVWVSYAAFSAKFTITIRHIFNVNNFRFPAFTLILNATLDPLVKITEADKQSVDYDWLSCNLKRPFIDHLTFEAFFRFTTQRHFGTEMSLAIIFSANCVWRWLVIFYSSFQLRQTNWRANSMFPQISNITTSYKLFGRFGKTITLTVSYNSSHLA